MAPAFARQALTPEEREIIKPALKLSKSSREIVLAVPGYGGAEVTYPKAHLTGNKIIPFNLKVHFETYNAVLFCLCLLVSRSPREDSRCILEIHRSKVYVTSSSCNRCGLEIDWDEKYQTAMLTRDFLDVRWQPLLFIYQIKPIFKRDFKAPTSAQPRQKSTMHMSVFQRKPGPLRLSLPSAANKSKNALGKLRCFSLSPTPSTSSVEGYKMGTTCIPWTDLDVGASSTPSSIVGCPSHHSSNAVAGPSSLPSTPYAAASTSAVALHLVLEQANNAAAGVREFDCTGWFERCQRCNLFFTAAAYKDHIKRYFM